MDNIRFFQLRKQIIQHEFKKMNESQQEAVFSVEGPLLVLAGAGSGKTTVIVNRIANLIKYGNAYNSETVAGNPNSQDVDLMQSYLSDDSVDIKDLERYLIVEPPKPWQILAITFTNKAANELKERLSVMLGEQAKDIWASTFHSACARILRSNAQLLGYTSHFTIYDTDDSKRTMKECQRFLRIEDKMISHKAILSEVSQAKNALVSTEEFRKASMADLRLQKIAEAYTEYQKHLKAADAMDFDDIIFNTVKLLENNEEVLHKYQDKFRYIMVDEYQDTNYAQYRLTALLAGKHKNICVVGDDDQSIYRFRGATIENILSFEKHYMHAKTIRLERNYRSTQTILDAANGLISHNEQRKGKNLWTDNGSGEKIRYYTAYDERDEGRYIADVILKNVSTGSTWNKHSVLYRMNAQSNTIENAFVRSGIPYRVIGGHRFYDRKEIRDALAYLTVINNTADNTRLKRIINEPKRGIGESTVNAAMEISSALGISLFDVIKTADQYSNLSRASSKLLEFSIMIENLIEQSKILPTDKLFELLMNKTGYVAHLATDPTTYSDRVANINELSNNLVRYSQENDEGDLNGFLEEVALMTDIDNYNAQTDTVVMMTIHSAKGLEFPCVFIVGMEEGVFPSFQSTYSKADMEEERRLAYVAVTRAKNQLYLTNTRTRLLFGSTSHNRPSRFINEIPGHLIDIEGTASKIIQDNKHFAKTLPAKKDNKPSRGLSKDNTTNIRVEYRIGDTVNHRTFGQGVLIAVQNVGNDTLLEIAFEKTGTKKLMANFAKLQKLP
jgi:DNA helicase II / ATP-dependent DNA helicase PcrA